jgi:hypothetical protein
MKARIFVLCSALLLLAARPLRAESLDQVIARARAYLGTERALNAVRSIHFTGKLEVDATTRLPADIVFQKDYQQRITVNYPKFIESTALDGYDAWRKRTNPANTTQWQVTLLDAGTVKRLRANTWENLNFFAGIEKKAGTVKLVGDVTVDGLACVKVTFTHAADIVFQRYFDKATGRLVKTETETGAEIREEGELMVNGVRFPRKVINKGPDGKVATISFDTVVLNEVIPAAEFAVPNLAAN